VEKELKLYKKKMGDKKMASSREKDEDQSWKQKQKLQKKRMARQPEKKEENPKRPQTQPKHD